MVFKNSSIKKLKSKYSLNNLGFKNNLKFQCRKLKCGKFYMKIKKLYPN